MYRIFVVILILLSITRTFGASSSPNDDGAAEQFTVAWKLRHGEYFTSSGVTCPAHNGD